VVDWAKVCADKARMDAIRTKKRAEMTVGDVIIKIRAGEGVDNECGERAMSVMVRCNFRWVKGG
jgi:hypothetical protein